MTITNDIDQLIYNMLTESTGSHILDSGGGSNRHWQRNQKLSLSDFKSAPKVSYEFDHPYIQDPESKEYVKQPISDSSDINYTINVFHWLTSNYELDQLCNDFNALPCNDWESDHYGISADQQAWLEAKGLHFGDSWNTYNYESSLSQVLQGTNVHLPGNESNFEYPDYILLQVHNGADVRGGYTDAKLLKITDFDRVMFEGVMGTIDGIEVENSYNGITLTDENGEPVPCNDQSKIELYPTYY